MHACITKDIHAQVNNEFVTETLDVKFTIPTKQMRRVIRKSDFCICESNGVDQLCSN